MLVQMYDNSSKKELAKYGNIDIRNLNRWLPRLEGEWFIYSVNIGVWNNYEKRYHVRKNVILKYMNNKEMKREPLEVRVWLDTPVTILIWGEKEGHMMEYRPSEEHKYYLDNKPMIEKGSEARYLANKMHKGRKEQEDKGIDTMKVRKEFKPELEKKHIDMEYDSVEKKSKMNFKGWFV